MIVTKISSKPVTTRFGTKNTFSFQADGQWYKHGFKKPIFSEGDDVSFDFEEGTYGKEVTIESVKVLSKGGGALGKAPSVSLEVPKSFPKSAFPISPLDGQRSIIRQNCVTNARELFVASNGGKAFKFDDEAATTIINLARKFEAYAAGDLDLAKAKEAVAKAVSEVKVEEVAM